MFQEKVSALKAEMSHYWEQHRPSLALTRPLTELIWRLYALWAFLMFFSFMLLCLPFIIIPIAIEERRGGLFAFYFMRLWGYAFCALSGIFFKIRGKSHLKKEETYIFVANHNSFLDSPAITVAIPKQFRPLGKVEILKMPIFGFIFRYIGITVDRSSLRSRVQSLQQIKKKLQKGIHVLIFPEGTMNDSEHQLLRFQDGAFLLAIETQRPIAPMVIKNTRQMLPKNSWRLKPDWIEVEFLEPIPTAGLSNSDLPALKEKVFKQMLAKLENTEKVSS